MLVAALTERDFGRLARMFAPEVRMRALIPAGPVELSGRSLQRRGSPLGSANQRSSSSFMLAATRSATDFMSPIGSG